MRMIFLHRVPGQNNDILWLLVNPGAFTKRCSLGTWNANSCEMNFFLPFSAEWKHGSERSTRCWLCASNKGLLEAHNGFVIILFITLRQLVGTGVFLMSLEEMIRRIISSSVRSQEREQGFAGSETSSCGVMQPQKAVTVSGEHGEFQRFWGKMSELGLPSCVWQLVLHSAALCRRHSSLGFDFFPRVETLLAPPAAELGLGEVLSVLGNSWLLKLKKPRSFCPNFLSKFCWMGPTSVTEGRAAKTPNVPEEVWEWIRNNLLPLWLETKHWSSPIPSSTWTQPPGVKPA